MAAPPLRRVGRALSPTLSMKRGGGTFAGSATARTRGAASKPDQPAPGRSKPARTKGPSQQQAAQPAAAAPADGKTRCAWSCYRGASSPEYVSYHDEEWGRPVRDDAMLFELLVLEGAQAGLSWATILAKRPAYRAAFHGFDPAKVAAMRPGQVEALLAEGSGVVRHRSKLQSAVRNAKVVLQLQAQHGSLAAFIWSFVPGGQPITNAWSSMDQVPTKTPEAEALSKALKAAGMSFVGPTTAYAFMQAAGLVNDHTTDCHCWAELAGPPPSAGRKRRKT